MLIKEKGETIKKKIMSTKMSHGHHLKCPIISQMLRCGKQILPISTLKAKLL